MTTEEYRVHFSLWALLAAPLIAGNDLRTMTAETKEILLNKEVIAVDQDGLGKQGRRFSKEGDKEIWVRALVDGSTAIGLFNRGPEEAEITLKWSDLHLNPLKARDLWMHSDRNCENDQFTTRVSPHVVVFLRVKN